MCGTKLNSRFSELVSLSLTEGQYAGENHELKQDTKVRSNSFIKKFHLERHSSSIRKNW